MRGLKSSYSIALALTVVCGLSLLSRPASAQTTVFNDNFSNGSTVGGGNSPGGTPTASSTSYDIASGKLATSTGANPGDLNVGLPATSSGFLEVQALFTSTPVTLATTGDYIDFTMTFTNTASVLNSGLTGDQFWIGLYNSGGSAPLTGLQNSLGASNVAGGTQNWEGFPDLIGIGGAKSQFFTRSNQTVAASDQYVLSNYANPKGNQVGNTGTATAGFGFNNGSLYTVDYRITLSAPGQLTLSDAIYNGSGTNSPSLFSQSGANVTGSNLLTSSFDGLAFGWLEKGAPISTLDANLITITDSITVPEPSSILLALAGLGTLMMTIRGLRRH
jgi:hypothetical protein